MCPTAKEGCRIPGPAAEDGPWRRVMLEVLAGRPAHEAHLVQIVALTTGMADRWAAEDIRMTLIPC